MTSDSCEWSLCLVVTVITELPWTELQYNVSPQFEVTVHVFQLWALRIRSHKTRKSVSNLLINLHAHDINLPVT